jgi:hypothetical protein
MDFHVKKLYSWSEFTEFVHSLQEEWAFRGQREDWPLSTSFERTLNNWETELAEAPYIESQIIRDFKRQYRGDDERVVASDTLYCLALMQPHGAPTRLLDWTYSPYVAAKFALETGKKNTVVWCINTKWCHQAAKIIAGKEAIDSSRGDSSFLPLYMPENGNRLKLVLPENPLKLNERLIIQQGVFMCIGDVAVPFVENLRGMKGWESRKNLIKIFLKMERQEVNRSIMMLRRMRVDSSVLFPGFDGFARSLAERIPLYADLARRKIGSGNYEIGSTL